MHKLVPVELHPVVTSCADAHAVIENKSVLRGGVYFHVDQDPCAFEEGTPNSFEIRPEHNVTKTLSNGVSVWSDGHAPPAWQFAGHEHLFADNTDADT